MSLHNNISFGIRAQVTGKNQDKSLDKKTPQQEKAWKSAQDLEATFASQMVQQMLSENDSGMFGGGKTEVMFRSVWAEHISKSLVGTFGVAESIYPIMLKKMEQLTNKR